jgi:signal transduction histidine kinase
MVAVALSVDTDNFRLLTSGAPDCAPESVRVARGVRVGCSRWAVAVLLVLAALSALSSATATEPKRVLFLHSFGRDFAPYATTVDAIRAELMRDSGQTLALYDESLDAGQAAGADDPKPLVEVLRHRFSDSPPDVVVTIAPPAAAFYLQNRDTVFRGTPAVLAAIDERLVPRSLLRPGDAVVASHHNPTALVDNILRLLPETKTIVVVLGASPLERYWFGEFRKAFAPYAERASFEWLNDLSFAQMRKRVAALPPHFAVLYVMLETDAAGVPHERHAALASLIQVSTAPIFSIYESELGEGVVGGPYQSQQHRGALTAAAVLRALSSHAAGAPEFQLIEYEAPVYDWRALTRWGIDLARLPAGSEIRFRPLSLWDEHRLLIIAAISIVLFQAVSLVGLVWQRVRRQRAEKEALSLGGRLITAHEDERRWLARELHDDITQRLAGLAIDAAQLPGSSSSPTDADPRRSIRGGLIQLSEDVHNLSYRLHPSVLDDLGLVQALKAECERVARVESLQVDVEADRLPPSMPKEVALGIYRVAQEALRNIVRHAKASTVQLSLALSDGGLLLTVTDNGSGFDPGVPARRPSVGHASMRERMRSLGGKLDIESAPGLGTIVVAWVPIPKLAS